MARDPITPTTITRAGVLDTGTAGQAAGHKFTNDGKVFIRVVNGNGAATRYITIKTPRTVDGLDVDELTVTVGTSATVFIGPFPPATFNQTSDGMVYMDYQATESDLTIEVYQF